MTSTCCEQHRQEAEYRTFLEDVGRLPCSRLVDAVRSSVYEAARRFRRADEAGLGAASKALEESIDALIREAQRDAAVERLMQRVVEQRSE